MSTVADNRRWSTTVDYLIKKPPPEKPGQLSLTSLPDLLSLLVPPVLTRTLGPGLSLEASRKLAQ
eukprot:1559263-Pyramimonas_sp.AAC.1